jgi:hypothetical protein
MDGPRNRNIFGAFALMISDDIVRATSSRAPEAGPLVRRWHCSRMSLGFQSERAQSVSASPRLALFVWSTGLPPKV